MTEQTREAFGIAFEIQSELNQLRARVAVLEAALRAMLTMSERGPCPQKLDEALTWRENDELAHEMARAALEEPSHG